MKFAIITAIAVTAVASAALLRSTQESETAAAAPRPDYSSLSRDTFADLDLELARERARSMMSRIKNDHLRKKGLDIIDDPDLTPKEKKTALQDIMRAVAMGHGG